MAYKYTFTNRFCSPPNRPARSHPVNKLFYSLTVIAVLMFATLLFTGCSTVKSAKLWAPKSFGMQQISHNVYVEEQMSEQQREILLSSIDIARKRIHLYYSSVLSDPEFVACATEACYQSLGGITSRAKAYGNSKILISPRGLTVPIIAHEWSHAELYTRVDGFLVISGIPRWFDEGLAVVVSNEPTHSEIIWEKMSENGNNCPELQELQSKDDWSRATKNYDDAVSNKEGYNIAYLCAGHEVRRWYRRAGRSGLAHFIETVRFNTSFEHAYSESEGRLTTAKNN